MSLFMAYTAVILISFAYNWLVSWLDRRGWTNRGLRALLVVGGVAYTLLVSLLVTDIKTVAFYATLFAAALVPVLIGDVIRYQNKIDRFTSTSPKVESTLEDFDL